MVEEETEGVRQERSRGTNYVCMQLQSLHWVTIAAGLPSAYCAQLCSAGG